MHKRIYKFTALPIERECEISEWLNFQENVAVSYSYFREGSGDIVSIFEVEFLDANSALLFDLKFSDIESYNVRYCSCGCSRY